MFNVNCHAHLPFLFTVFRMGTEEKEKTRKLLLGVSK
jgi:hypothetical protein